MSIKFTIYEKSVKHSFRYLKVSVHLKYRISSTVGLCGNVSRVQCTVDKLAEIL